MTAADARWAAVSCTQASRARATTTTARAASVAPTGRRLRNVALIASASSVAWATTRPAVAMPMATLTAR